MHKKVTNELNFWHRIYVPEVIRGIWITSVHFFTNLGIHILHVFGMAKKHKGMVTFQYPEDPRPPAIRLRARHRLMKRANGTTRCVACMMCETICPAHCIYIVAEEDPDPRIEKRPKVFDINLGLCVVCGYCVEACPEDAIRMDTYIVETSSYSRDGMIITLEDLMNHDNQDMYPRH
ncbi:MAG: NADH-quinone oxidoreductase subunit I [Acidobacteria bacterium]|nr:NADH-quinone oxidoreductase subunit I [Acidobacteriota bacterium]